MIRKPCYRGMSGIIWHKHLLWFLISGCSLVSFAQAASNLPPRCPLTLPFAQMAPRLKQWGITPIFQGGFQEVFQGGKFSPTQCVTLQPVCWQRVIGVPVRVYRRCVADLSTSQGEINEGQGGIEEVKGTETVIEPPQMIEERGEPEQPLPPTLPAIHEALPDVNEPPVATVLPENEEPNPKPLEKPQRTEEAAPIPEEEREPEIKPAPEEETPEPREEPEPEESSEHPEKPESQEIPENREEPEPEPGPEPEEPLKALEQEEIPHPQLPANMPVQPAQQPQQFMPPAQMRQAPLQQGVPMQNAPHYFAPALQQPSRPMLPPALPAYAPLQPQAQFNAYAPPAPRPFPVPPLAFQPRPQANVQANIQPGLQVQASLPAQPYVQARVQTAIPQPPITQPIRQVAQPLSRNFRGAAVLPPKKTRVSGEVRAQLKPPARVRVKLRHKRPLLVPTHHLHLTIPKTSVPPVHSLTPIISPAQLIKARHEIHIIAPARYISLPAPVAAVPPPAPAVMHLSAKPKNLKEALQNLRRHLRAIPKLVKETVRMAKSDIPAILKPRRQSFFPTSGNFYLPENALNHPLPLAREIKAYLEKYPPAKEPDEILPDDLSIIDPKEQ